MNATITTDALEMKFGGALRPFQISTLQTAIFCELQKEGFDLQDYNRLFTEVAINQHQAKQARELEVAFTPTGRKALTPTENAQFLYSALAAGLRRNKQPVPFSVDEVMSWIDEAENSEDPTAFEEAAKPLVVHYQLLLQKINRQNERAGNVPAPTATHASRGETPTA